MSTSTKSTRLRQDVVTIFDVCCEIYNDQASSSTKVLYPPEFNNDGLLKSISQFAFPSGHMKCTDESNDAVQLFTFVLTDSQSQYTFAYCRYTPKNSTCLCILSGYLWVNLFYNLLKHISNVKNNGTFNDVETLLQNAYHLDFDALEPGSSFRLDHCPLKWRFSDQVPDITKLPALKDDRFMLEFYSAANEKQMIQIYSAVLKERRMIFTTDKLSQLSSCAFAASRLLYPFHWQNLFIPILPHDLAEMLMAPMPYICGVPKSVFSKLNRAELTDAVIVDLDCKTIESPYDDSLPAEAYNFLRQRLKSSTESFLSDTLVRSFLQTNALIFGRYAMGFINDEKCYVWDKQTFLTKQKSSMQNYLNCLIGKEGVQYFERFVDDRLYMLNSGTAIMDEFEKEIERLDVTRLEKIGHNLKENAVISAIKGQLNNLTSNDKLASLMVLDTNRKSFRRMKKHSPRRAKKNRIDPLFIDTAEFGYNGVLDVVDTLGPDHTGSSQNSQTISEAESVRSMMDLIDLSDESPPSNIREETISCNAHSTPNLQLLVEREADQNLEDLLGLTLKVPEPNSLIQFQPLQDISSETVGSNQSSTDSADFIVAKQRSNWETFE